MLLSWKANPKHVNLLRLIRAQEGGHPDPSRSGITQRAILRARNQPEQVWRDTMRSLSNLPMLDEAPCPSSMVAEIDDSLVPELQTIEGTIKRALEIRVLRTNYLVTLLWAFYYSALRGAPTTPREAKENTETDEPHELSDPQMMATLTDLLLSGSPEARSVIEEVKQLLLRMEHTHEHA